MKKLLSVLALVLTLCLVIPTIASAQSKDVSNRVRVENEILNISRTVAENHLSMVKAVGRTEYDFVIINEEELYSTDESMNGVLFHISAGEQQGYLITIN